MTTLPADNWNAAASSADGTKLVAASINGSVYKSSNSGATWTLTSAPFGNWDSLASSTNGTKLAAAAVSGSIYTSTDSGTTWTLTSAPSTSWQSIASSADGTKLIAAGGSGVYVSANSGATWVLTSLPSTSWRAVASSADGVKLIAAPGGSSTGPIYSSTNSGITWTVTSAPSQQWVSAASSADGTRLIAAVYNGLIFTSANSGGRWTATSAPFLPWETVACSADGAKLAAGAYRDGLYLSQPNPPPPLSEWTTPFGVVTSQDLTSVIYGTSNFVAVGFNGTVLTSSDGGTWTSRNSGTSLGLFSVTYGNGLFVAVGQIILSSANGITWTTRDTTAGLSLEAVAYVNGSFMAVGDNGTMRVSADGISWSSRASGTATTLYGLAYGNGKYVVVGAGGTIRTSSDGVSWTARSSGTAQDINGVTYANGLFLAQGNSGVILTSTDGLTWTARSSGTGQGLATSAYGSGNFVIVGLGGTILSSSNGVAWTSRNSGSSALLIGIAYAGITNGPSFVVVGFGGTILQSDAFPVGPAIALQPQSQVVTCLSNALFSVTATGTSPLSYQWRKNSTAIAGATTNSYVVTPSTCQTPDSFAVVITNIAGAITSSIATLTVMDTNPPTTTCPANLVLNTDPGQCSAIATYAAAATDNCAVVSLVLNPPSGSVFPKGTNLVTCTATDCAGNSNTCTFTVTVLDHEAPALACPSNQTVACNSTNGAQVFFTAMATDNCDGSVPVVFTPPSGSFFALGTNTVTAVATDSSGNSNRCTFIVTVVDTTPPVIVCPANLVLQTAPGQCWATATYAVTATDNCAVVSLTINPPSGSVFSKGTNVVNCVAVDCGGNSNTCAFTVTILDHEPPVLTCATNQTVSCLTTNGVRAFFSPTALDICDGAVPVICTPPSGSVFRPGATTVSCVATDASGNSNSCSLTITAVLTNTGIFSPPAAAYGRTYSEWSAAWWVWNFSLPATNHPLLDTGDVSAGQSWPVWFLGGTFGASGTRVRNCTIPEGTALFFPIVNAWADNSDCPNPDNFTESQLRGFARGIQDQANGMSCTIDGVPVAGLDDPTNTPYRVQSPVFDYLVPAAHNLLYDVLGATCYTNNTGTPLAVTGAVADGVFLMLPPLAVGAHTIHFSGAVGNPASFTEDITYNLTVVSNLGNAAVFPPGARLLGKSYGEWSAAWWQWCFSLPAGAHPLFDTADGGAGQNGPVWFLGGTFGASGTRTRNCSVPDGKFLFFPIINNWADDTDCPVQDSFTEAQLRALAGANQDQATNLTCTIDGLPVTGLADPIHTPYRVTSPVFTYTIPGSDNLLAYLGLACYTNAAGTPILVDADAVSDGVFLLLPPLWAGPHTIHFYGAIGDPPSFFEDITYNVTVAAPALTTALQGSWLVISWPQTATSYVLEQTDGLSPANWLPAGAAVQPLGGVYQVTIPMSQGSQLFRLRKQ